MNVKAIKAAEGNTELAACHKLTELASQVPRDQAIVELGAYKGRTTGWLALGVGHNPGQVVSVDPWGALPPSEWPPNYIDTAGPDASYAAAEAAYRVHMDAAKLWPYVTALRATAQQVAAMWMQPVGLLYHDGVHTADAVEADLRAWLPHMADQSIVALHDAGNPRFGVAEGAKRVLGDDWDWPGELLRWRKHPDRRGLLILRRR